MTQFPGPGEPLSVLFPPAVLNRLRTFAVALALLLGLASMPGCLGFGPTPEQEREQMDAEALAATAPPPAAVDASGADQEPHPFWTVMYGAAGILGVIFLTAMMIGGGI